MKYNNIITHTSNGKPVKRNKMKDLNPDYRPEEQYLCFKEAGQYGVYIYSILKHKMGMDKFQFGSYRNHYVVSNREWKRYGTRQRKNEALEDLAEAGLLEIVEAAPGKNKKVRLLFE